MQPLPKMIFVGFSKMKFCIERLLVSKSSGNANYIKITIIKISRSRRRHPPLLNVSEGTLFLLSFLRSEVNSTSLNQLEHKGLVQRSRQRCSYCDSAAFFVLRNSRSRLTLNETGFVTVTLTKTPGVFSWFECDAPACPIN